MVSSPHLIQFHIHNLILCTMPPKSTSKGEKLKGATVSVSLMELSKKATRCSHVSATPVQDLGRTTEEEDPTRGKDGVSHQLKTMMKMLVNLSKMVQATKSQQREKAVSLTASPSTSQRRAI